MYQLIIKNGKVICSHGDHQDIAHLYPGTECILWSEELGPSFVNGVPEQPDDPRTKDQRIDNYLDKRRVEYPSIQEQLDMIYHDKVNATSTWVDAIDAVKIKYPKLSIQIKEK